MGRRQRKNRLPAKHIAAYESAALNDTETAAGGDGQAASNSNALSGHSGHSGNHIDIKEKKPEDGEQVKLSKTQKKRMAQLEARREKKKLRGAAFQALEENSMGPGLSKLLVSSGQLGKKDTKRQQLKRALFLRDMD
eukprot:CAMPEP_0114241686 /NCGR_PEP_ID=MMETSP0058-20121206/9760_1 /TAXON_ID=36894 /ORGANISM="Pyramimonas parkeae, CCMP726" /LENGTH=136 /DNA_ID=CAMNT_0001354219 /DNA_START=97 /DNA_END=508 /DNA_ORIENTATION=-